VKIQTSNSAQTLIVTSPSIQMTNNPKGREEGSRDLSLHAQFWTMKNCAMAGRPCLTAFNNEAYTAGLHLSVQASLAINQGSNSTGSICCGFVANLFVKHVKNKSNQWSLILIMHYVLKAGSCQLE